MGLESMTFALIMIIMDLITAYPLGVPSSVIVHIKLEFNNLNCCFLWREENWNTERKTLRARQKSITNSTHRVRHVRESNLVHKGGRGALIN